MSKRRPDCVPGYGKVCQLLCILDGLVRVTSTWPDLYLDALKLFCTKSLSLILRVQQRNLQSLTSQVILITLAEHQSNCQSKLALYVTPLRPHGQTFSPFRPRCESRRPRYEMRLVNKVKQVSPPPPQVTWV